MHPELEALLSELLAIPASTVQRPRIPIAVAFQEAHDQLAYARSPEVLTQLLAVGLDSTTIARAAAALEAARQSQSAWAAARQLRTPEFLIELRAQAERWRAECVAALRWNLRGNRVVQGAVDAVQEGSGDADLVQDLLDLSALISSHSEAFEADTTFDAPEASQKARDLASALRSATSDVTLDTSEQRSVDVRDRAYTHLELLMDDIRTAGRYALRNQGDEALRFGSAYARRRVASRRRSAVDQATPPE